jgi:hypothetical protein
MFSVSSGLRKGKIVYINEDEKLSQFPFLCLTISDKKIHSFHVMIFTTDDIFIYLQMQASTFFGQSPNEFMLL